MHDNISHQHLHTSRSLFYPTTYSCILFGAGNYALLAAKINTKGARQCLLRHYVSLISVLLNDSLFQYYPHTSTSTKHIMLLLLFSSVIPYVKPDTSHPYVLRNEFLECNEQLDLIPTILERTKLTNIKLT